MATTTSDVDRDAVRQRAIAAVDAGWDLETTVRPLIEAALPAKVSVESILHRGGVQIGARCEGLDSPEVMAEIARETGGELWFDRGYGTTKVTVEFKVLDVVRVEIGTYFVTSEIEDFRDAYYADRYRT